MYYNSTRDNSCRVTAAQAISQGISAEGGLFVPEELPKFSLEEIGALTEKSYNEKAKAILARFLTDFSEEELAECVDKAYTGEKFDSENISEIAKVGENTYLLELWHGPTCAFKDMALQLLPYLLTTASKKAAPDKQIVILVATSGDTGKAALEGFKDVPGTRILVFYPRDGVSPMQKLQMVTQEGANVGVCAIEGNFDDAQSGVKKIFTDKAVGAKLAENGLMFSSANSINWGRLVPQIVYYCSAYADMLEKGNLQPGEAMDIVVPTGNFGNILAAYYAKLMGVPVGKLICASNANNVLTDFLTTGTYDRNRTFFTTMSPSMDILISSNLERLLFHLSGEDDAAVRDWMGKLAETGVYTVSDEVFAQIKENFDAGCADDATVSGVIRKTYEEDGYLSDTHTGVAITVYRDYIAKHGDETPTVIAATASPYKFSKSVLAAVLGETPDLDEFDMAGALQEKTGVKIPAPLSNLKDKTVRFTTTCPVDGMEQQVYDMLGI